MEIDVRIEDDRWSDELVVLAERACTAALSHLNVPEGAEMCVMGCNDARIAELNAEFREKDKATNVLSWPATDLAAETDGDMPDAPEPDFPEMPIELGDMAISYDTCMAEADQQGKEFANHVVHLLVHGTLHLLGFDHIRPQDGDLMERLETEILATLGIADPYE